MTSQPRLSHNSVDIENLKKSFVHQEQEEDRNEEEENEKELSGKK